MSGPPPNVFSPAGLGPVTLRNRVIKSATFEGRTPDALVTDDLIEFHAELGRGGVGMTTVAYLAVSPEGRTHREQLYWREEALPGLRRLTDAVHATGARVSAQIGHAGPVANAASNGAPSLSPTTRFNPLSLSFDRKASPETLTRIVGDFARAAAWARDVGFDAVEVHLGHTYLPGAFLSPAINKRRDAFGGSLEHRAEFSRRILEAVRRSVGSSVAVLAKLNMHDGVPNGLLPAESLEAAKLFERDGHLDALELTGGSSLLNPMYLFRGDAPKQEFADAMPLHVKLGIRAVGGFFLKAYPFEPLYFLEYARAFRAALKLPLVLLGGVTGKPEMDTAMREGFEFVAMARALLREPDLLLRLQDGSAQESKCSHCNKCMPSIYSRTRCTERPD